VRILLLRDRSLYLFYSFLDLISSIWCICCSGRWCQKWHRWRTSAMWRSTERVYAKVVSLLLH